MNSDIYHGGDGDSSSRFRSRYCLLLHGRLQPDAYVKIEASVAIDGFVIRSVVYLRWRAYLIDEWNHSVKDEHTRRHSG